MGCYINPENETKEEWLAKIGLILGPLPIPQPKTHLLVCLVHNTAFTAAGVCFDDKELEIFSDPRDNRPKIWFSVPREKLYDVSPLRDYEEN